MRAAPRPTPYRIVGRGRSNSDALARGNQGKGQKRCYPLQLDTWTTAFIWVAMIAGVGLAQNPLKWAARSVYSHSVSPRCRGVEVPPQEWFHCLGDDRIPLLDHSALVEAPNTGYIRRT